MLIPYINYPKTLSNCFLSALHNFDSTFYSSESPLFSYEETNTAFLLRFEVPGYAKKDLSVEIDEDILIVKATKNGVKDEWKTLESKNSNYVQEIIIPKNVDINNIVVKLIDGVLRLTLPKEKSNKKLLKIL